MMNGLREKTQERAAGFRWHALFWLFAVLACAEAPLAHMGFGERMPAASIAWVHDQPSALSASISEQTIERRLFAERNKPWIAGDSVDDALADHFSASLSRLIPRAALRITYAHVALDASAFNSRAPPLAG